MSAPSLSGGPVAPQRAEPRRISRALIVVLRNAVPVVGVFVLGWSADLVLLNYWFDGFSALAAIIAVIVPFHMREVIAENKLAIGPLQIFLYSALGGAFLVAMLGIPYLITLIVLWDSLIPAVLAADPLVWVALLAVGGLNLHAALQRNYNALPVQAMKQALRWDVYLLILRGLAMLLVALPFMPLASVVGIAVVLCCLELFPARALRAVFGDPDLLWKLNPDQARRNRDR